MVEVKGTCSWCGADVRDRPVQLTFLGETVCSDCATSSGLLYVKRMKPKADQLRGR